MDILDKLVQKGILLKKDVTAITNEAVSSGATIEEVLIKHGVSPQDILVAKGEYFDIPVKNLEAVDIPHDTLEYIPENSASHYRFVPIAVTDGVLEVGMVDPDDIEGRDVLNFISSKIGKPIKIYLITEADFNKVITLYKGLTGEEIGRAHV